MRLKRRSPSVNLAKDAMAANTAGSPFSHRACAPNGRGGKAALDSGQENARGVFRDELPALRALHGSRHAFLQAPDMCASGGGIVPVLNRMYPLSRPFVVAWESAEGRPARCFPAVAWVN